MNMPASEPRFRIGRVVYLAVCGLIFTFLLAPLLVIVPLSFNAEPYFTFTEGMLRLDPEAYSLRWYRQITGDDVWTRALGNSLLIGVTATALATALGTLAALGLSSRAMPARHLVTGLLISPMVTPLIISATGMFFFYSTLGLSQTHLGLILAHAALGTPFVVITVTATLSSFDTNLTRAAASLGAGPFRTFRRVQLPLIAPGVLSGALFAFAASFDEVVVVLFMAGEEQRTIPRQMWAGIREQISPAILAVATFLIVFAVLLLCTVEWLGRRGGGAVRERNARHDRNPLFLKRAGMSTESGSMPLALLIVVNYSETSSGPRSGCYGRARPGSTKTFSTRSSANPRVAEQEFSPSPVAVLAGPELRDGQEGAELFALQNRHRSHAPSTRGIGKE